MDLLEKARLEVEELKRQRDAMVAVLDAKIAVVEQTVKMLEPVYTPMAMIVPLLDDSIGITEAIETALRKHPGRPLAPTSVRDVLAEMKFKINGDNPMASVHQVLKRLIARAASPYVSEQVDGQTMYKFDPAKETVKSRLSVTLQTAGLYDPTEFAKRIEEGQMAIDQYIAGIAAAQSAVGTVNPAERPVNLFKARATEEKK